MIALLKVFLVAPALAHPNGISRFGKPKQCEAPVLRRQTPVVSSSFG
jgi:hypothetical protein